ncbi:MAG: HEAT repeat domain-containing protein, partial [Deltaproteobacteria bacterium]|nr:HEAT repeat domain-containing protein [Deltaproteobacteria bacterium]
MSISLVSIDARSSSALSFEGQEARLARELREGVTPQRVTAASEIATLAPRAAWPLVQLGLADPEIEVRRRAATAAEELGLAEALELTRPWLESDDADLREIAVHAEGVLGDAASVASLSRALGDPRFAVRSAAAEALGRLELAACASPLGTALEDTDATVRMVAAGALGRTPGDEAARLLLSRSLDPVLEVRVRVIDALAARGDRESFDGRVGAVLIAALADEATEVRVAAIVGLARARHAPAAPLLSRILDQAGEPRRASEDDRELRAVVAALGRLDDPSAREALVRTLGRGIVRSSALRAIRTQLEGAPEAMERALAAGLASGAERGSSPARGRVLDAMLELDELEGGEALLRPVLVGLEDGTFSPAMALAALGAFMPRAREASLRPSPATEEAVVVLLSRASEPTTVDAAIDGLERAARRGVLDPRSVEVLLLPEVLGPPTLADDDGGGGLADDRRAARVVALLGRMDDPRAFSTLVRVATGPEGPPRRAALLALSRSQRVDRAALSPLSSEVATLLRSRDPEERAAICAIALRHGDDDTLRGVLDALEAVGSVDRA